MQNYPLDNFVHYIFTLENCTRTVQSLYRLFRSFFVRQRDKYHLTICIMRTLVNSEYICFGVYSFVIEGHMVELLFQLKVYKSLNIV